MSKLGFASWRGWAGAAALAGAACGGGSAGAKAPGTCPEGTVLQGQDCLPAEAVSDKPAGGGDKSASGPDKSGSASAGGGADDKFDAPAHPSDARPVATAEPMPPGAKTPYEKDAVEVELKRGARQVKANCGAATDDEGRALGPWGKTQASITLGRNGHVKAVSLPEPYAGKPVAICVSHAFDKIQFPPYAGDTDAVVAWDVELVRPKGK
jgi:hypothetical protein